MTKQDEGKECQLHPDFMARLRRHPELHERIDAILRIVDDTDGDAIKADEAEERVAQEVRQMGHAALQAWAERKLVRVEAEYAASPLYKRREKKGSSGTPGSER